MLPDISGVYGLYDYIRQTIFYPKCETNIRQKLIDHWTGLYGPCTKITYYFNTEIGINPDERLKSLLEEHKRIFEKLPICNEINKKADQK